MSTTVYTGFRFLCGPEEFPRFIRMSRKLAGEYVTNLIKIDMCRRAVEKFDRYTLAKAGISRGSAGEDINFMSQASTNLREQENRYDVSFVVYELDGNWYGRFFAPDSDLFDRFLQLPEIEEFRYWNNVDPEDDMDEEEWERRSDIWDRINDDSENGVHSLFKADLVSSPWMTAGQTIGRDEIAAYLPPFEDRVRRMAVDLAIDISVAGSATSDMISAIGRYTHTNSPVLEDMKNRVRPALKREPDDLDLWGWR